MTYQECIERSVAKLVADPMVRLMMDSDGVTEDEVRRAFAQIAMPEAPERRDEMRNWMVRRAA